MWLCNTLIPEVSNKLNLPLSKKPESWISGTYNHLKTDESVQLIYLFPNLSKLEYAEGNTIFVSYPQNNATKTCFCDALLKYKPDIIQAFGTENASVCTMLQICLELKIQNKLVLNIQGIVSMVATHYYANLPHSAIYATTLRDFVKRNNIWFQKKNFELRGKNEINSIKEACHVIGRTDWDEACVKRINPDIKYHFCNETLRPAFYNHQWNFEKCEKHSIFVSQCNYPIKGFHLMLEAMVDIVKRYPDAHLYTTGLNPLKVSFKQKLTQTYYQKYIGKLIKKYHLENHVTFLGYLDEQQMCDRFLKSHVFVSCSSIENSPNSVGEAMLLGTPVVSSDVGGVKNMLTHNKEGFIYPYDEPYMIAYYISRYFEDSSLCERMSQAARTHAQVTHDIKLNYEKLLTIYNNIVNSIV